jgi:hypothetical protein
MVELRIDSRHLFVERANTESKCGGWVSVWKTENEPALIMFGHDECIFKQVHTTNKSWKASNGKTGLIPKDDGQGVIISTFQSREFGFGRQLAAHKTNLSKHLLSCKSKVC